MSIAKATIEHAEALEYLRRQPTDSVDLVICSPPYEDARTYGIDFRMKGQDWVDWASERFRECVRVSRGLVVWVVEGKTKQFRYSATPALLMADLHRSGVHLRKPPIFHRVGIPGSGGPDFWRNDYEWCIVGSKGGKLPWSDNTANGHPPKWAPGGETSNRLADGARVNQWGHSIDSVSCAARGQNGLRNGKNPPSHKLAGRDEWGSTGHPTGMQGRYPNGKHKPRKIQTRRRADGTRPGSRGHDGMHNQEQDYMEPVLANAGNVIKVIVGGGVMGSPLAHENEAPFPESLVEPFIRCFSPPNGTVCDIFSGSGTTAAVALTWGRNFIGCDIRESQVELSRRRITAVQPRLLT